MFCPDCGSEIAQGRAFCGKCGARLRSSAVETPIASAQLDPTAPATGLTGSRKSSRSRVFAYISLLVIAGIGGAAWWWFHRPAPAYQVKDPGIYPFLGSTADGTTKKWGFLDAAGKVLIPPTWDGLDFGEIVSGHSVAFSEGLCGVQKDGKWGYIDQTGSLVIPIQFESVGPFVEGLARIHLGNQIGYIDRSGHYAINPQFFEGGDFHEGLAAVRGEGGWGFIDKAGDLVLKPTFQSADPNGFSSGLAGVCIDGRCGYIDRTGRFVIRPQFQRVGTFSEGLAAIVLNGKVGFVNRTGTITINPQFEQATMFSGGMAAVSVSGRQGTINKEGKFVVNPGQFTLGMREGEILDVAGPDGMGLMKNDGQPMIPPTKALTGIGPIYGSVFLGNIGGQAGLIPISLSGKVLYGPYKDSMLQSLSQDIENESSAIQSMHALSAAELAYSGIYPSGFSSSLAKLGPAAGTPDQDHANLIDATLASGNKDGYQFTVSIPPGTSTGGSNFNYFLIAKPVAGHAGRTFCTDSTGTLRYAPNGQDCTVSSPTI